MFASSVQRISRLDSQSKFQMFTVFSGRHVGGAQRSTNMATPYTLFQNGRHLSILLLIYLQISPCCLVLKLDFQKNIFP